MLAKTLSPEAKFLRPMVFKLLASKNFKTFVKLYLCTFSSQHLNALYKDYFISQSSRFALFRSDIVHKVREQKMWPSLRLTFCQEQTDFIFLSCK